MGYTVKQKIEICLKRDQDPSITQQNLALWAQKRFGDSKPPAQTTISRILMAKSELVAARENDFGLTRRRKVANPLLRRILTEWVAHAAWESIPITTPIIQLTAYTIWTRLPTTELDGHGVFTKKWSTHFYRNLEVNLRGTPEDINVNARKLPLNKVWRSEDKVELKQYLADIISLEQYAPQDIFALDEFLLFYTLPLDQIFDVSSVDKGLRQASTSSELSLTLMLGCNVTGTEKLPPLVVGKYEQFDISDSDLSSAQKNGLFAASSAPSTSNTGFANKIEHSLGILYKSNTNKWITSSMFHEFLLTWDHKLANGSGKEPRKVLLLLDDSSSHRILNLKFDHIRLCYLENNSRHMNPYSSNSTKFDCLPMHYGIIEEFKKLFRQRHYQHMTEKQRQRTNADFSKSLASPGPKPGLASLGDEVLSHRDYRVPLARALCWIEDAWKNVPQEAIFCAWRDSRLLPLSGDWPQAQDDAARAAGANDFLSMMRLRCVTFDRSLNYNKLVHCILNLNVVMPWEADQLLVLVNERAKVTLDYGLIEEIIGSCLLEPFPTHECNTIRYSVSPPDDANNTWLAAPSPKPHTLLGKSAIDLFTDDLTASMNLPGSVSSSKLSSLGCQQNQLNPRAAPQPLSDQKVPPDSADATQFRGQTPSVETNRDMTPSDRHPGPVFAPSPSLSSLTAIEEFSRQVFPHPTGPRNHQFFNCASPSTPIVERTLSPLHMSPWKVDARGTPALPDLLESRDLDPTIVPFLNKLLKRKSEPILDTSKLGDKRRQHLQVLSRRTGSLSSPPVLGPTSNRIFGQLPHLPIPYPNLSASPQPHQHLYASIQQVLNAPSLSLSASTIRELRDALCSLGNDCP